MKEYWKRNMLTISSYISATMLIFLMIIGTYSPVFAETKPGGKGSFHLVGTGPGDPDLLTVRALSVIDEAEIIFAEAKTIKKLAPQVNFDGKKVYEGYGRLFPFYKQDCSALSEEERSKERMSCEQYHRKQNELVELVENAVNDGKKVAMLTGGDPAIYGPSVWTVDALADSDPVVVPGLSALNAANASLKAGLGEIIITAPFREQGRKDTIESLAGHERATMIIFMPRNFEALFARLASVYPENTPVAVVSNAGCAVKEKRAIGTMGDIVKKLEGMDVRMSIVYVGKALARAQAAHEPEKDTVGKGKFYLVGIGPGDNDLATLRAMEVIEKADLIFAGTRIKDKFDAYLEGKTVMEGYHRLFPFYGMDCSKVTPEQKARERMSCEEYHQKQRDFAGMVRKAVSEGKTVAMLDNGDPLIYGPCSWSLVELSDLDTEVVPGLSAFNAANAAIGKKVTGGKSSHSVILASGWSVEEMAVHQATMVLFTMRTEFKKFIDALSKHYPPDTPVAIVVSAGYKEKERVMHAKLGNVLERLGQDRLPFEYLLYVGDFLR